jgi:hypothetical protein
MIFNIQGEMPASVTLIISFSKSGKVELNAKIRSR